MAELTRVEPGTLSRRVITWFLNSFRFYQIWRQQALTSYKYVEGDQWKQEDLAQLRREKRPPLTIPKILPQIMGLSGIQRGSRFDIRALPIGDDDTKIADFMSGLIKYTAERSLLDYEQSYAFEDGNIAGAGFLELVKSYDDDLDGELLLRRLDPLKVFLDPEGRRSDLDDARFIMKAPFKDPEELIFLMPEMKDRIEQMARSIKRGDWLTGIGVDSFLTGNQIREANIVFLDHNREKVRTLECYYRVPRIVPVVIDNDGEAIPYESREQAEDIAASRGGTVATRTVKVVRHAFVLGWEVLRDEQYFVPTRRFPIVPYFPLQFRTYPYGFVRFMISLQDEINKRRSQMLHHINSVANSGWLNDANAGADPKLLEQHGSRPGIVITHRGVPPARIEPMSMPTGLAAMAQEAEADLKDIGAAAETLGQGSQRFISGKAMNTRQTGDLVKLTRVFDQLRLTRKILGELLVQAIPATYSEAKIRKILHTVQVQTPQGPLAQLGQMTPDAVTTLIRKALSLRYDIQIEDDQALPTHRMAQFQALLQVALAFPGMIGPDELIAHTDLPDKDELVAQLQQRMKQLPPGGLAQIAAQGRKLPGNSEQLDQGDIQAQAATNQGGQPGSGGA